MIHSLKHYCLPVIDLLDRYFRVDKHNFLSQNLTNAPVQLLPTYWYPVYKNSLIGLSSLSRSTEFTWCPRVEKKIMAELLLDSNIRFWVFLPIVVITFLIGILRHYATILLSSEKKVEIQQITDRYNYNHASHSSLGLPSFHFSL